MRKDEFPLVDKYVNQVLDNIVNEIEELDDKMGWINADDVVEIIKKYKKEGLNDNRTS